MIEDFSFEKNLSLAASSNLLHLRGFPVLPKRSRNLI